MEKVSQLIGKLVISIFDGEILGITKNVIFDDKHSKIIWIEFFDEDSECEYMLNSRDIHSIGDAIMLKNRDCVHKKELVDIDSKSPMNVNIFSISGKYYGKIIDVELDENLKSMQIVTDNQERFSLSQFLNIGKTVAILQPEKQTKIANFKSKVKILDENSKGDILVSIQGNNQNMNKISVPKKVLTDSYNFLLGRKLDKNIYADNKQLIAKKHSIITNQIIDLASKHGKLKELTFSSFV